MTSSTKPNYFNHKLDSVSYSCKACGLYEDLWGYVKSCPAGEFDWKEKEEAKTVKYKVPKGKK